MQKTIDIPTKLDELKAEIERLHNQVTGRPKPPAIDPEKLAEEVKKRDQAIKKAQAVEVGQVDAITKAVDALLAQLAELEKTHAVITANGASPKDGPRLRLKKSLVLWRESINLDLNRSSDPARERALLVARLEERLNYLKKLKAEGAGNSELLRLIEQAEIDLSQAKK